MLALVFEEEQQQEIASNIGVFINLINSIFQNIFSLNGAQFLAIFCIGYILGFKRGQSLSHSRKQKIDKEKNSSDPSNLKQSENTNFSNDMISTSYLGVLPNGGTHNLFRNLEDISIGKSDNSKNESDEKEQLPNERNTFQPILRSRNVDDISSNSSDTSKTFQRKDLKLKGQRSDSKISFLEDMLNNSKDSSNGLKNNVSSKQNSQENNQLALVPFYNNQENKNNQCCEDFHENKQKRKWANQFGGVALRNKQQTPISNGLSEESEEELFFEQCRFTSQQPYRKQADLRIEFEKDDKNGSIRKIEIHKVVTDFIMTANIKKEIDELKKSLSKNFIINQNSSVNGFVISHEQLSLHLLQREEVLNNISLYKNLLDNNLQSLLKNNQNNQQLALLSPPKISTSFLPLYDMGSLKEYLEEGKFKRFFNVLEELGRGGFGRVYKVQSFIEGKMYAVKQIIVQLEKQINPKDHKYFREVTSIMDLNHINILRYHTCWWEFCDEEAMKQVKDFLDSTNNNQENSFSISREHEAIQKQKSSINSKVSQSVSDSIQDISGADVSCVVWENSESQQNVKSKELTESVAINQSKENKSNKSLPKLSSGQFNKRKDSQFLTLYIQLEYCSGRTLRSYLDEKEKALDSTTSFLIFSQILEGVQYLHSNSLIHRDLKPSNILFSGNIIKIGDFGLSIYQVNQKGVSDLIGSRQNLDEKNNVGYTGNVGTPLYMPPEQRQVKGNYDQKIDVYSLGIILLEMIYKMETQHEKLNTINKLISKREAPKSLLNTHKQASQLVILMTDPNSGTRPSIEQIKQNKHYLEWKGETSAISDQTAPQTIKIDNDASKKQILK